MLKNGKHMESKLNPEIQIEKKNGAIQFLIYTIQKEDLVCFFLKSFKLTSGFFIVVEWCEVHCHLSQLSTSDYLPYWGLEKTLFT